MIGDDPESVESTARRVAREHLAAESWGAKILGAEGVVTRTPTL